MYKRGNITLGYMYVVLPHCLSLFILWIIFFCFQELESSEDNQLPSSPLASPSNSSTTKKVEDQETAIDVLERPSPVSVLEPLYIEDDVSPASTRSLAGRVYMKCLICFYPILIAEFILTLLLG